MILVDTSQVRIENRPVVRGLPDEVYVEYFGYLPDGRQFVIFRPRDEWDYNQFRCLLQGPVTMEPLVLYPVRVTEVARARDGGTTQVHTTAGDFLFPSPFAKDRKPTFQGQEITVLPRMVQD